MFCSRCGTEVAGAPKFCPTCGLDLQATTPVQAIAAPELTELDIVRDSLGAKYEVVKELGRGGMAIVFRAKDKALDRDVAIKVLPFSLAFDQDFVERFQREAKTAAGLEHPNIIPIYSVDKAGRVIYFVMKFIRGGSLAKLLQTKQRLTPPEIRRLLIDAGSALGFAAQRGIVHRDIKPDNMMFDEFGRVVVCDFGIAKAASGQRLTGTGMAIGTPHYMSPEQARAQPIDGRSDIYSLGVVAYQCLVGEVPYDGEDSFTVGLKHIQEPLPQPELADEDEQKLFAVIQKMTEKDPAERFQSCEELIAAIIDDPVSTTGFVADGTGATGPLSPLPVTRSTASVGMLPGKKTPAKAAPPPPPPPPKSKTGLYVGVGLALLAAAGGAALLLKPKAAEPAPAPLPQPQPQVPTVDSAAIVAPKDTQVAVTPPPPPPPVDTPKVVEPKKKEPKLNCAEPSPQFVQCFDESPRPKLLGVEVPGETAGEPQPFELWVKVDEFGVADEVRKVKGGSGVPAFDKAAQFYAQAKQKYTPATKGGHAITAWFKVVVQPK